MAEIEFLSVIRLMTAGLAAGSILLILARAPRTPLAVYFALFSAAMFCAALGSMYGDGLGPLAPLIAIGGFAGCGWAWLFARALFQSRPQFEAWPLALVAAILAPEIVTQGLLASGVSPESLSGPIWRIAENMQGLASSTVLVLAFAEAVRGYGRTLPQAERRFRQLFMAGYGSLVAIAVLWVSQSSDGTLAAQSKEAVQTSAAFAALAMAALAARYRFAFPIAAPAKVARIAKRPAPTDPEAAALSQKIDALVRKPEVFSTANLKVSDVAAMLGEAEYKVSRCVVGAMGFANFNRLINHHRIERAKEMLGDPAFDDQPILVIGLDCGFGSIGPFNRAFKEATGETPRGFRNARTNRDARGGADARDNGRLANA